MSNHRLIDAICKIISCYLQFVSVKNKTLVTKTKRNSIDFYYWIIAKYWKAHSKNRDKFWELNFLQKWWKTLFISPQKLFSFWRYLIFLSRLFGHVSKWQDKKDKVNFKFNDVTAWLANNRNTHIGQYLEN